MRNRRMAFAVTAMLLNSSAWAVDPLTNLSINSALSMAGERNPAFSKAELKFESARLTYLKDVHGLGWVQSFSSSAKFGSDESFDYKIYNTSTSRRSTFTKTKKMDYVAAWNRKRTQSNGTLVDLYSKLNVTRSQSRYKLIGQAESLTDATSSKYRYTGEKMNPEIGVNLTYPILGPDKNSSLRKRQTAEVAWLQAQFDFDEAREQLVFSVRQGYYDLYKARETTKLRKQVLAEAEDRVEVMRKRLGAGMTTEMDVSQAELSVLRSRADLADAVFSEQQALSRLNSLIGLPLDKFYTLTESFPAPPSDALTLKTVHTRVLAASNPLKRADKDVELASVKLTEAKGKLSPDLEFNTNLAMEGERRSFRDVVSDPESKYSFGLNYVFPFGEKVTEKADVELAQGTLSEKVIARDEERDRAILEATETYQELQKIQQRLSIARQSIDVSRKNLTIAQAKFDEGRAEITDIIKAKESLVNAQVEELSHQYTLAVTQAKLERQTGEELR